jgi:hypothetical protein
MPSLVERRIQRRFSAARMRTMAQVLLRAALLAEPAVVGNVEQHFRAAARELAHEIREDRFVADEGADLVMADRRDHHAMARGEIARFGGDLVGETRTATARIRRRAPGSPCRIG